MKTKLVILMLVFLISCATAQTPKPAVPSPKPTDRVEEGQKQTGPDQARVPGELSSDGESIIVPAGITVGKDFDVTVRTGGNGCWNKGDDSVVLGENSADIFVYDMTNATKPGTMCTMIYKQFDHKVTLRFAAKGEAVIRVWTRATGDGPMGKPVIVEKRVIVK